MTLTTSGPDRLPRLPRLPLRLAFAIVALFAAVVALAQAPQASLDRTEVALGESVTLTIQVPTASPAGEPDWRQLAGNFQVTHPRRSTRHMIRNGRAESSTQWEVTLLPRRPGTLTIPPLTIGPVSTAPLALRVTPTQATSATGEPVFIETTVDHDSVYVDQQLLLTIRVHHAVPLDDMRLSEPEFNDATVYQVAQTSFSRTIDGATYRVHELRYAIFPHSPGELLIPELAFTASRLQRPRSLFDFPGQGTPVSQLSARVEVNVKPIPAAFSGPVWLPATNLTLVESWSQSPQQLRVGESATRTLTMAADGLPPERLPSIPEPDLQGARLYADQPSLDKRMDAEGIHGTRVESAALIASEPGPIALPGVKVIWWDVEQDIQQVAEILPQRFEVGPGSGANVQSTQAPTPTQAAQTDSSERGAADARREEPQSGQSAGLLGDIPQWGWLAALAIAVLGWLMTAMLYWRLRRRLGASSAMHRQRNSDGEETALYHAFLSECEAGRPEEARRALLRWARSFYGDPTLRSTRTLRRRFHSSEAQQALDGLDAILFAEARHPWEGHLLARAIDTERQGQVAAHRTGGLPNLYPETL